MDSELTKLYKLWLLLVLFIGTIMLGYMLIPAKCVFIEENYVERVIASNPERDNYCKDIYAKTISMKKYENCMKSSLINELFADKVVYNSIWHKVYTFNVTKLGYSNLVNHGILVDELCIQVNKSFLLSYWPNVVLMGLTYFCCCLLNYLAWV